MSPSDLKYNPNHTPHGPPPGRSTNLLHSDRYNADYTSKYDPNLQLNQSYSSEYSSQSYSAVDYSGALSQLDYGPGTESLPFNSNYNHSSAPPLPPKPPPEYVNGVTAVMEEFNARPPDHGYSNDVNSADHYYRDTSHHTDINHLSSGYRLQPESQSRVSYQPAYVDQVADKRPSSHPLGPRLPSSGFNPQQHHFPSQSDSSYGNFHTPPKPRVSFPEAFPDIRAEPPQQLYDTPQHYPRPDYHEPQHSQSYEHPYSNQPSHPQSQPQFQHTFQTRQPSNALEDPYKYRQYPDSSSQPLPTTPEAQIANHTYEHSPGDGYVAFQPDSYSVYSWQDQEPTDIPVSTAAISDENVDATVEYSDTQSLGIPSSDSETEVYAGSFDHSSSHIKTFSADVPTHPSRVAPPPPPPPPTHSPPNPPAHVSPVSLHVVTQFDAQVTSPIDSPLFDLPHGVRNLHIVDKHVDRKPKRHSYAPESSQASEGSKRLSLPSHSDSVSSIISAYDKMPLNIPRSHSTATTADARSSISVKPNRANTTANAPSSVSSSTASGRDETLMAKLNLPSIPDDRRRFDSSKLSSRDFEKCKRAWALSNLSQWIISILPAVNECDITVEEVAKAFVGLFTHVLPTLNWVYAERLALEVVQSLRASGFVQIGDEGLVICINSDISVSGVLPTLSGGGCYSTYGHDVADDISLVSYRCYSSRCSRTLPIKAVLPEVSLSENSIKSNNTDWASYWNLSSQHVSEYDDREIRRQYSIHELIAGEESYVRDLKTLLLVFGESLSRMVPPIMKGQKEFWDNAFGNVQELIDCNSNHLLRDLKHRQTLQGPFVNNVGDIMLNWIKLAKEPYVKYANSYLLSDRRLRSERESNPAFSSWLERASKDPRAKGSPHSFFFHRALPRLARYGLLLRSIQKSTLDSDPEWQLLARCIAECDIVTGECNARVAQVEKRVELLDLKEQIQFKSFEEQVDLRMSDKRRKVIRRGNVIRRGDYRVDWVDSHVILLDHFLILSKLRKGINGTRYYVTKKPIPLDLLVLESVNDDAVTKSSASKFGVGTFTTVASDVNRKYARQSLSSPISPVAIRSSIDGVLGTTGSHNSGAGSSSLTVLSESDKDLLFPFKIRHLGHNGHSYTLYSSSQLDRDRWHEAIVQAKREYSSTVYAMNAEPFRLKVVEDIAFGYDSSDIPKLPIVSPATALDRALQELARSRSSTTMLRPLVNSKINCGVSFIFVDGREIIMLGLDYGLYARDSTDKAWQRCLELTKITQIDVIEDLNVLIVLADKALVYYNLDAVLSKLAKTTAQGNNGQSSKATSSSNPKEIPGYRLSKHREVGFFSVAFMKDRTLLFYKRRDGISSVFKVMEPIKEKGSQRRRSKISFARNSGIGSTEYFRDSEKFYVPVDSYGISMFKSSFAVHTSKGFEVMSLDSKVPNTVPIVGSITSALTNVNGTTGVGQQKPHFNPEALKKRLENAKPIGMFRTSENSLILCYDEFAIFCDNYGNMASATVINFVCLARSVCLQHPYLLVADEEMVEVRHLDRGGQLKQVISGKDIRLINTKESQIMIALAHPTVVARQIVVELISNEFVVDDENSSLMGL